MNLTFVFWITALYTVVLFGLQIYELLTGAVLFNFAAVNAAYLALLSAYVGGKEVTRWTQAVDAQNPLPDQPWRLRGEYFVGLWAISLPGVTLMIQFWPNRFHYPAGLNMITLEVLGFYLGSNVSRWLKVRDQKAQTGLEKELDPSSEDAAQAPTETVKRWISKKRLRYEESVLALARKQGSITREDVQKLTRLKITATVALLNGMVDRGLLRRAGTSGSTQTHYEPA